MSWRETGTAHGVPAMVIDTYKDVSQFWRYDPAAFLAAPVYSRDYPPAKNIE